VIDNTLDKERTWRDNKDTCLSLTC